ncbi:MAG: hypothetical protein UY96_C0017G0066 [Parcubacteria group bacterium GW2011_GWB1_56_8]|nr:MAG: hypothetical protein UY96_C0017G0066 [Parcubacteria group bacterium GW2011_GWB1_56_8]
MSNGCAAYSEFADLQLRVEAVENLIRRLGYGKCRGVIYDKMRNKCLEWMRFSEDPCDDCLKADEEYLELLGKIENDKREAKNLKAKRKRAAGKKASQSESNK